MFIMFSHSWFTNGIFRKSFYILWVVNWLLMIKGSPNQSRFIKIFWFYSNRENPFIETFYFFAKLCKWSTHALLNIYTVLLLVKDLFRNNRCGHLCLSITSCLYKIYIMCQYKNFLIRFHIPNQWQSNEKQAWTNKQLRQ